MSSLPQGWHGIPVPTRNSMPSSVSTSSTVPTTIRKKWNSPLSSEVPRSKLPSYKPSTVRLQRSSINNTLHIRSTSKSPVSQGDSASCPAKPVPTKELKNEIAKLKKELTTVKTENSILKVKVRRVDDENIQKSRQIEKLRVELKTAQKNETAGSKKNKDSELLLLRQKCLRLEGALKEKDLVIKKLTNEIPSKTEVNGICTQSTSNEFSGNGESKQECLTESKTVGKSASSVRTNLSRASLSSKGEVSKLRDMIHKLEKENQDLQQQVKEKGEEIKRLKLHLRSRTYIKSTESSVPKFAPKTSTNSSKSSSVLPSKLEERKVKEKTVPSKSISSSTISKAPIKKLLPQNTVTKNPKPKQDQPKKSDALKSRKNTFTLGSVQPRAVPKKQGNGVNSKLPLTKPGSTFVVAQPIKSKSDSILVENNIEDKVERLRENIAAKKIQRSWRTHRNQVLHKEEPEHIQKSMTFIVTSLKYHKMRKEKLNFVGRQKHIIPKLKDDDESAIVEAIRAATKNLWEREVPVVN